MKRQYKGAETVRSARTQAMIDAMRAGESPADVAARYGVKKGWCQQLLRHEAGPSRGQDVMPSTTAMWRGSLELLQRQIKAGIVWKAGA